MEIAFISDIHSNFEALSAVMIDIKKRNITKIFCAGDIVGYGANPNECINELIRNNVTLVQGNHDYNALTLSELYLFNDFAREALMWTNKQLTEQSKEFLSSLPKFFNKECFYLVHGSPKDPIHEYMYPFLPDLESQFLLINKNVLVTGHTHLPLIKKFKNNKILINPGSVGQPRDGDKRASYAIYDTSTNDAKIVRVEYDIIKAMKKIVDNKLPRFLAERLETGNGYF